MRSSAIFPVVQNNNYTSSIHYLGYWLLKRNILEVTLLITLRDLDGNTLLRKSEHINNTKAFRINLQELLSEINFDNKKNFLGSIETEFNTTRDMVFPYPALVLEYHNQDFNTCVHTLGRVYNDFEDLKENTESHVPETGFDIHETDDLNSFLSFVNGPIPNEDGIIDYVITNSKSKIFSGKFHIGCINPFETKLINFKNHIPNLSEILDFIDGTTLMGHNIDNFDLKFLNYFLEQEITNKTIDTLNISRSKLGNKVKNHKLKTLAEYFNVVTPTHTARDDVMTTFEVYKKLSSIQ